MLSNNINHRKSMVKMVTSITIANNRVYNKYETNSRNFYLSIRVTFQLFGHIRKIIELQKYTWEFVCLADYSTICVCLM